MKEEAVAEREAETMQAEDGGAKLNVSNEEAREVASLLRYAISLNTTAGLLSPTERRLTSPAYRAVELAAFILEGKTFQEALQELGTAWTGSLEEDHRSSLEIMRSNREELQRAMTGLMNPNQIAEFFEISQNQFLELVTSSLPSPPAKNPED